MTDIVYAIHCHKLGKRYFLRDNDANPVKRLTRHLIHRDKDLREHWALRDVSLAIKPGESVALIGVNGSGKSTLLKLITGITRVTDGDLRVQGRVGGILDLGAGFHPDLTGFENIFLQATLLGLPRNLIWKRLKSIEEFCELDKFLNSPVRHYSMGMFLRLAFAIAVHTDPDIFIIDEALAVGDGYFQWKCMKKLEEMKRDGKTLLYVSHTPEQVESLCERAIWMHEGRVRQDGAFTDVVQDYHNFQFSGLLEGDPVRVRPELSALIPYSRFGTGEATIKDLKISDVNGNPKRFFQPGEDLHIQMQLHSKCELPRVSVYYFIERPGRSVSVADSSEHGKTFDLKPGLNPIRIRLPAIALKSGPYLLTVAIGKERDYTTVYDAHQKIYSFTIIDPVKRLEKYSSGFITQKTAIGQQLVP